MFEDPSGLNYETDYGYDVLNNLLRVDQKGSSPADSTQWRTRTFTYDSLSEMLCASNPELSTIACPTPDNGNYTTGTIRYSYDANGNLATRKAPYQVGSTVTTTLAYDALNRLILRSYSDSTPAARFAYDGQGISGCTVPPPLLPDFNPVGNRTGICDGSGGTSWNHDPLGRVLTEYRFIGGAPSKTWTNAYNLDGSVASITYPSGRIITYTYGGAGRQIEARDVANGINYATSAHYIPAGTLSAVTHASSIRSTVIYDFRLRPCWIYATTGVALNWQTTPCTGTAAPGTILDLKYLFTLAGDNGNIASIINNRDNNRSQNFTYDPLNRIATAYSQAVGGAYSWGESFSIDAWGNLTNRSPYPGKTNLECLNAANPMPQNRLVGIIGLGGTTCTNTPTAYDSAGNLTQLGTTTFGYDAENLITSVNGSVLYIYDSDGNRVKKLSGTIYWGPGPLAESDLAGTITSEYIFFNGKRIARVDPSCCGGASSYRYYFSDHLGSASVVTDNVGVIKDESDYYPFGGEITVINNDQNYFKFTGKERGIETGLDYFGARYHASTIGRFTSPDPISIALHRLADPQLLNLYAYGRNNPLKFTDSTGLDVALDCTKVNSDQCKQTVTDFNNRKDAQFQVSRNGKTGILEVNGKVDPSKLSSGERALYDAITNTDHHATLSLVGDSDTVQFGRFNGNGQNTLDRTDLNLAGKANGQLPGEIIAHEALESYGSTFANGANYDIWHGYPNQFFGNVLNGPEQHTFRTGGQSPFYTQTWNFQRMGVTFEVKTVVTPIPAQSIPTAFTPGKMIDVQPVK